MPKLDVSRIQLHIIKQKISEYWRDILRVRTLFMSSLRLVFFIVNILFYPQSSFYHRSADLQSAFYTDHNTNYVILNSLSSQELFPPLGSNQSHYFSKI